MLHALQIRNPLCYSAFLRAQVEREVLAKASPALWWSRAFPREPRMSLWCLLVEFVIQLEVLRAVPWAKGQRPFQAEGYAERVPGRRVYLRFAPCSRRCSGEGQRPDTEGGVREGTCTRSAEGRTESCRDSPGFQEPSQWMSYILCQKDVVRPAEALGKDLRLGPSRALCRGVGSCFVPFG